MDDIQKRIISAYGRVCSGGATRQDWDAFAFAFAMDTHENDFQSRRGFFTVGDCFEPVIALYDNNPYRGHPTLRDEVIAELRDKLEEIGVKTLGVGSYPPIGQEQPGYTVLILVGAGEDRGQEIEKLWSELVKKAEGQVFLKKD